ncbi:cytochrome C oxidase subunit IV family protein [Planctomycetota bacterium]|nr:cytochrome C oxidase subunit IV family protein [Planctomycetota bacterium]
MSQSKHAEYHVHVVPLRVLFAVFAALIILTILTVGVTKVDLGGLNIWIALGVAVVKAVLVALYFMHLRWDSPYNGLALVVAFVFVGVFIGFALKDSLEYQKYVERPALLDRLQQQTIPAAVPSEETTEESSSEH